MKTTSGIKKEHVAVIVFAYKRPSNLKNILLLLLEQWDGKIFVSVDGAKPSDVNGARLVAETIEVAREFSRLAFTGKAQIDIFESETNVGLRASVLGGLDRLSSSFPYFIVLEDDCMPNDRFLESALRALQILEKKPHLLCFSGHNTLGGLFQQRRMFVVSQPFTWGWASTSRSWKEFREWQKTGPTQDDFDKILASNPLPYSRFMLKRMWRRYKYLDSWALDFEIYSRATQRLSLVSGTKLISNLGDDLVATHTPILPKVLRSSPTILRGELGTPRSFEKPSRLFEFWQEVNIMISWAVEFIRGPIRFLRQVRLSRRV